MISRNLYLNKLIENMNNGLPKVITGIRRCGKSYLLNNIPKSISYSFKKSHLLMFINEQIIPNIVWNRI